MNIKEELIKLNNILTKNKSEQPNTIKKTTVLKTELTEENIRFLSNFRTFREGDVSPAAVAIANHFSSLTEPNLNHKIDQFIYWCNEFIIKESKSQSYQYQEPKRIRNFIEKMAIWYELRYPSYEINRIMPCCGQESIKINDVMFRNNLYVNELLGIDSDAKELEWQEFYNKETFIKSLPWEEYKYLETPTYISLGYIEPYKEAHLHISSDGFITSSTGISQYTNNIIKDEEILNKHIKEVISILEKENIQLPNNSEIKKSIELYEKRHHFKEELLNCVMYRIIERGGGRIGPRRAYLFAKEFGRNIDIPMMYAHDFADANLRSFINEYIKDGGSKELICYKNYFYQTKDFQKLDTISIEELLKITQNHLTKEETELHQKIVGILNSQIDETTLKKETVKQLRLERKLKKSKNTKTTSK